MSDFSIAPSQGNGLLILGDTGSGKSGILSAWAEEYPRQGISAALLSPLTQASLQAVFLICHQERFVSITKPEDLTVGDLLTKPKLFLHGQGRASEKPLPTTDPALLEKASTLAGLSLDMLGWKVSGLSHGELRRTLLTRSLMEGPRLLLLDDPLGGVDPDTRNSLAERISRLPSEGYAVVVASARQDEPIPGFQVTHLPAPQRSAIPAHPVPPPQLAQSPTELLANLEQVQVRYGDRTVLGPLTLQIRKGHSLSVVGNNGSGKSTLLSLLSGDHPQMFRNTMELFGARPGHGLDIHQHRRRIALFSPELLAQFHEPLNALYCVCTGFGEGTGLVAETLHEERRRAQYLLDALGIGYCANTPFHSLSWGERRLILLARALAPGRELVLLDEPTGGLDLESCSRFSSLLQAEAEHSTFVFATHYPDEIPHFIMEHLRLPSRDYI